MLKKCYFEPCLLQVLSTFCLLISIINPICTLRSPLILLFLQAIYAKIVELIQARRIRVKISIAYQRPEGKKSRKCKERGVESRRKREAVEFCRIAKISQSAEFRNLRNFAGCTVHTAKFHSILQNFLPAATVHYAKLFMSPALFTILLFDVLTHFVPFLVFFQICPL